jgi:DNA-3-methyladenine glycosylase I
MDKERCSWAGSNPLMVAYHDTEWGVPCHDDGRLFEYLVLDTFQAGLSWLGILLKREGLRVAFVNFDARQVAEFIESDIERLVKDAAIIRNRAKIKATINNAHCFLKVQSDEGTFADYLWGFVDDKTVLHAFDSDSEIPTITPLAEQVSRDMKARGFQFVGPTTIYAYLQGIGIVNDHLVSCFRYNEV